MIENENQFYLALIFRYTFVAKKNQQRVEKSRV